MHVVVVVVVEVEEQTGSILRCKDSSEWLFPLTLEWNPRCPLCCVNGPPVTPFRGIPELWTAGFDADEVKVELALGKEGGFGVGLGKVFEDLPPEDFRTTGGGPDESGRVGFTNSGDEDRGCFPDPRNPLLETGVEGVEPDFEDVVGPAWKDLGEVLRMEAGALDKRAAPVLEAWPDAVALEDVPALRVELEVTGPDLEDWVRPEDILSTEDALLLLTVAWRILRFSSLTILSLSSLHCLSLACLSLSKTSNKPVATRIERPGASRAKSESGRGSSSTGLTPHRAHASRERGLVKTYRLPSAAGESKLYRSRCSFGDTSLSVWVCGCWGAESWEVTSGAAGDAVWQGLGSELPVGGVSKPASPSSSVVVLSVFSGSRESSVATAGVSNCGPLHLFCSSASEGSTIVGCG